MPHQRPTAGISTATDAPLEGSSPKGEAAAQSEDLRATFEHFDENKDGQISKDEMSSSLQRLGLAVPAAELAELMTHADTNADGFVNYEEFVGLYKALAGGGGGGGGADAGGGDGVDEAEAELREAFEVFDEDGDGLITAHELHSVLKSIGVLQGRNLADCVAMISRVDSDGNGQVDFQEFKEMMSSGMYS